MKRISMALLSLALITTPMICKEKPVKTPNEEALETKTQLANDILKLAVKTASIEKKNAEKKNDEILKKLHTLLIELTILAENMTAPAA